METLQLNPQAVSTARKPKETPATGAVKRAQERIQPSSGQDSHPGESRLKPKIELRRRP